MMVFSICISPSLTSAADSSRSKSSCATSFTHQTSSLVPTLRQNQQSNLTQAMCFSLSDRLDRRYDNFAQHPPRVVQNSGPPPQHSNGMAATDVPMGRRWGRGGRRYMQDVQMYGPEAANRRRRRRIGAGSAAASGGVVVC